MANNRYQNHIQLSGDLFESVQKSHIFPDSKHFVDMVPVEDPDLIIKKWNEQKNSEDFDLKSFIDRYFSLPDVPDPGVSITSNDQCRNHIRELWPYLFRQADENINNYSSLIPLPKPYVVPGGRFREIYYWDSYFTARGLAADGHKEMVLNMAENFKHLIDSYGHIPNGNRIYYLSRSQPPFFVPMIELLVQEFGKQIIPGFYEAAVREYNFWMDKTGGPNRRAVSVSSQNGKHHRLNRYWDDNPAPREESWKEDVTEFERLTSDDEVNFYRNIRAACESGWDFSSRWFADGKNLSTIETTNILPVDLNTLLWNAENRLAEWSAHLGKREKEAEFIRLADQRKSSINTLMWDGESGFFFDFNIRNKQKTDTRSLASVYPLYFKFAEPHQTAKIAKVIENQFLKAGGLLTTTKHTGQQWDAPNGWAPLQWLTIIGLRNYGFTELSDEIKNRWLSLNEKIYRESGKMVEKYNVVDTDKKGGGGEYPLQDGFGWTNGVFSALSEL